MHDPGQDETAIRRRAYEIWEAEGRPHGRDREHWDLAARELGSALPMPAGYKDGDPAPDAAPKKKAAPRRRKAAEADAPAADAAAPKPARKRRAAPPVG